MSPLSVNASFATMDQLSKGGGLKRIPTYISKESGKLIFLV